ncbi:hypothetical protein BZA05DRAFT_459698 [Tricharina praecox]|uniref:uncharacterized protein n=1 Tax=Tricharina praecox TaxID=43433 RepID=UPI002220860C|nr:uncharacterized protein BZA05DRAFT_459698 [Tricharina praecox]KAI5844754.1 hypothetical protein BZA05DRAFT_459698 [Tricharina praecox]
MSESLALRLGKDPRSLDNCLREQRLPGETFIMDDEDGYAIFLGLFATGQTEPGTQDSDEVPLSNIPGIAVQPDEEEADFSPTPVTSTARTKSTEKAATNVGKSYRTLLNGNIKSSLLKNGTYLDFRASLIRLYDGSDESFNVAHSQGELHGPAVADGWANQAAENPDDHGVEWLRQGSGCGRRGDVPLPVSLAHLKRRISHQKWREADQWSLTRIKNRRYDTKQPPKKTRIRVFYFSFEFIPT